MPLGTETILARDAARLLFDEGWVNVENLTKMLCTVIAESSLYVNAWQWNDPAKGGDGSTDVGLFQLNDGNKGGNPPTVVDGKPVPSPGGSKSLADRQRFYAIALDPKQATGYARALYVVRQFQPWVAYNSGAWKKHGPTATYAIRNMLHVYFGWPLA
jgi:hypothetical protein